MYDNSSHSKRILKLLFLSVLTFVVISCNDDDDFSLNQQGGGSDSIALINGDSRNIDISDNFGAEIQDDFFGEVVDKDGNPLMNVQITIGEKTFTTDENGVFQIENATVYEDFAYIRATKDGYVDASRSLVPVEGINQVKIMMLPENVIATVNSGEASSVTLSDGSKVDFDGHFITASGSTYSGAVDVIAYHLKTDDENLRLQMPGMLYGANNNAGERLLQSYGMMSVELRGENGVELNLAQGSPATLTFTLSDDMAAHAPETIPLWYFDEDQGYWIEQGEAHLQNGKYVGDVRHFSFWNCDVPSNTVELNMTIVNQDGEPLSNIKAKLISENYGNGIGFSNTSGNISGLVPSNEQLDVKLFYITGYVASDAEEIYSEAIGPLTSDTELTLTIDFSTISGLNSTTVQGTVQNCQQEAVSDGCVKLTYQGIDVYEPLNSGSYEVNKIYSTHQTGFTLEGIDINTQKATGVINYNFSAGVTSIGNLQTCEDVDEYIEFEIDDGQTDSGFTTLVTDSLDLDNPSGPYLNLFSQTEPGISIFIRLDQPIETDYTQIYDNNSPGFDFSTYGVYLGETQSSDVVLTINNFGDVGEYIDLTFQGNYVDYDGSSHFIQGSAHVLRDDND